MSTEERRALSRAQNEDYRRADDLGLTRIDRWGEGREHTPLAQRLVAFLAAHDFADYDDSFCWKTGGDGDNGETLAYQMDAFFESGLMADGDESPEAQQYARWVSELSIIATDGESLDEAFERALDPDRRVREAVEAERARVLGLIQEARETGETDLRSLRNAVETGAQPGQTDGDADG